MLKQIDCIVALKDHETDHDHKQYTLLRQNEPDDLIIYVKLPKRGLYALELFGKLWDSDSTSFPHISTYLIAASTAAENVQPYPAASYYKSGQRRANIT